MSRILCVATPKVKPVRKSARAAGRFGAGLLRFTPFVVLAPGFVEPSDEDRAAAAQMFAADADWSARMTTEANGDQCELCDRPVERGELAGGLCNACQARAEDATMASRYYSAGLGFRAH